VIKKLPSHKHLKECFRYDSKTGKLYWNRRPTRHFVSDSVCNWWNARYAEQEAFTAISTHGYFYGNFEGQHYLAHRIIWKLVSGSEPPPIVDHKDRDRKNNRWFNLREASKGQNNVNSSLSAGVSFDKARNKWAARTKKNGKMVHLGRFETWQEARQARIAGVKKLFGEFAP
jgi:hypothetical protein